MIETVFLHHFQYLLSGIFDLESRSVSVVVSQGKEQFNKLYVVFLKVQIPRSELIIDLINQKKGVLE